MKAIFSMWILFIYLPLLSQGQQRWEKIIGGEDTSFVAVCNTISYDRGELISANSGIISSMDHLLKVDRNGDILWSKRLHYENWNTSTGIKQSTTGNSIVYGTTYDDASVVMLDGCGNLLWCNEYNESQDFRTMYSDAVFLENSDIVLLMAIFTSSGQLYDIGLISFDNEGNNLWFHPFKISEKYPQIFDIYAWHLDKFDDFLMITGWGYYTYPENPNLGYLKPMFIKTDANFYEEWLLPYGLAETGPQDTILGDARGVVSYNNGVLHGWGKATKPSGKYKSILMNFDMAGIETTHHLIEHEMLDSTTTENFFLDVAVRDDTSYFTSLKYGNLGWNNPTGEAIIDTMANVYQHQAHDEANLVGGQFPVEKDTINDQYYLAYWSNDDDLVLYKFNNDLSDTPIDTTTYNYDSLCGNLPIVSDTIYLDNCSVITGVEEIREPQEYYTYIQTIPVHIFPNPATRGVTFELGNTEHHKNIRLSCFDINGKLVFERPLANGQTKIKTNVTNWPGGMYIAVASSSKGGVGSAKFLIR